MGTLWKRDFFSFVACNRPTIHRVISLYLTNDTYLMRPYAEQMVKKYRHIFHYIFFLARTIVDGTFGLLSDMFMMSERPICYKE